MIYKQNGHIFVKIFQLHLQVYINIKNRKNCVLANI